MATMRVSTRNTKAAFFVTLGACLVALAAALNVGWIILNWREVAVLILGIVFFLAIIAGLILNTIFLVREIRRNEQHDSFINAVTHELKTPIASIRLYLETLKAREVPPERRREFYDIMLADNDQLLHTVEQVLRAGSLDHRRGYLHKESLDLAGLVLQCTQLARSRYHLDEQSLRYEENLNGERPMVLGDAEELRAVMANLLDNAIKYSFQEVKVLVEVSKPSAGQVLIKVSDSGLGIPADQLKRVFKRFYRVPGREPGRVKGTGLGLFIVRSVVRKHRGRVLAKSAGEGQGSTFSIELPTT
jgi:two-component system, OmpR family, sensor histidine kinase SenX3